MDLIVSWINKEKQMDFCFHKKAGEQLDWDNNFHIPKVDDFYILL